MIKGEKQKEMKEMRGTEIAKRNCRRKEEGRERGRQGSRKKTEDEKREEEK